MPPQLYREIAMLRLLSLLLLFFVLPANAGLFDNKPSASFGGLNNSSDFLPVREAFKLSLVEASPERITLRFVAAEGYYLYRHRFAFQSSDADVTLGEPRMPDGVAKVDDYFGEIEAYYGILDIELPVTNTENRPFTLQVTYQGCADKGLCYPPETESITIGDGAAPGSAAAGSEANQRDVSWRSIALFFLAGLGLTFTPCVLPMLPILTGVVLRGQPGGMRSFLLSVTYVLPMAGGLAVLGALMGVFGAELNLQARLQSAWILVPFALFFVVFALAMFGMFELRLPQALSGRLDRLAGSARGGSFTGAAMLGAVSSLLVSPCVSAPLAGALLYISASGDALGGGLKLFALGLGMGAPLVLFATGGGALLPKSGPWMVGVRNLFGVLLLAVAIWMLERVLPGTLGVVGGGQRAVPRHPGAHRQDASSEACPAARPGPAGLRSCRLGRRFARRLRSAAAAADGQRQRAGQPGGRRLAYGFHACGTGRATGRCPCRRPAADAGLVCRLVHQLQGHRTRGLRQSAGGSAPDRLSSNPLRYHREQCRPAQSAGPLQAVRPARHPVLRWRRKRAQRGSRSRRDRRLRLRRATGSSSSSALGAERNPRALSQILETSPRPTNDCRNLQT